MDGQAINPDRLGIYLISTISTVLFVGGLVLAKATDNAHYISRSGAGIVALTLLITFIQFRRDEAIQRARGSVEAIVAETYENVYRMNSDEEAASQAAAEIRMHYEKLTHDERRRLLGIFVIGTFIGTVFHGFGDLLGALALGISFPH